MRSGGRALSFPFRGGEGVLLERDAAGFLVVSLRTEDRTRPLLVASDAASVVLDTGSGTLRRLTLPGSDAEGPSVVARLPRR